jgi:glycine hydroxymethyltransferase
MSAQNQPFGLASLADTDPEIAALIRTEEVYEADTIRLIASENYASRAVLQATGSVLTNKYSEGYAHKRYYQGQAQVDAIEELAKSRLAKLFGAEHVNVQPYSGSPANLAVYVAFAKAGETIMGLGLPAGGHLTHGWSVSVTGKLWNSVAYGVRASDHRIDMDQVRELALANRPKLIWCGATAYPRFIDFAAFRSIADEVGAILAADIAHISGLVAAGVHPSPVGIADVVTSTTHKTLRGPRGGLILSKAAHAAVLDKAVFPGLQGGPHNHTTAALAVAALEASQPSFKVVRAGHRGQRQGPRRGARGARFLAHHGRHGQPSSAGRHDAQGARRKALLPGARAGGPRGQLQLDPLRSAQAVRPVGRAPGYACGPRRGAWAWPR